MQIHVYVLHNSYCHHDVCVTSAMALLGGSVHFLSPEDIHLGVNESIKDSGR